MVEILPRPSQIELPRGFKGMRDNASHKYKCAYCNTEYENEHLFIACGQMHVKNGDRLLPPKKDNINPPHYKSGEIECIDAIKSSMTKDEFQGALKANILKYILCL